MLQTNSTHTFNPHLFKALNRKDGAASLTIDEKGFPDFNQLIKNQNSLLKLTSFFEESKILKSLTYTWVPAGDFYGADRLILKFSLADHYAPYFSLLRGLFDFGRRKNIVLSSSAADKTFQVEVSTGDRDDVVPYFEKIFSWLAKEITFKTALKQVIRLQDEARRSQQEALALLYDTAA